MRGKVGPVFLLVAAVSVFMVLINLGGVPLLDPDEPVYAETPKEMLLYREFLSPRIYGEYWYDKPPLYYWLVVASYRLFGVGEFAARFPSALLFVACALILYQNGRRLFNERAGLAAALVFATSLECFYLGKAAVTDMTLTVCLTGALLSFIRRRYYGFYFYAALATLAKGPVGLLFPGAVVVLYAFFTRDYGVWKRMKLPAGIVICGVIALPWYGAMYYLHGAAFVETFFGFHNIARFTTPEHPSGLLWYYYIPVLLLGFFPWTALMGPAVRQSLAEGGKDRGTLLFLNLWAWFILLFFSVSRTKLVSYILPMFPALALIAGWYIDRLSSAYPRRGRPYGWLAALAVLAGALAGAAALAIGKAPFLQSGLAALAAILLLTPAAALCFLWRRRIMAAFWTKVAAMLAVSAVLSLWVLPPAAPYFSVPDILPSFRAHYDGRSPVYVAKFLRPGFSFYSGLYGEELVFSDALTPDLTPILDRPGQAFFLIRTLDYRRLPDGVKQRLLVLEERADKMLLQKAAGPAAAAAGFTAPGGSGRYGLNRP